MGQVILGPEWLHELYLSTPSARKAAERILRAYMLLYRRRSHVLNLDVERVRTQITYGLKRGYVEECVVECVRCRNQAFLTDWIKSTDYDDVLIAAILADNRARVSPLIYRFLLPCDECLRLAGTQIPDSTREAGR